ncbi:guanine deaminase [Stomoxys calcitrans]|uniref:guanine deaminase n=1 Tax=Stomoxys calcitrans TaxID=35570 RepID=UPI0027E30F24|nr:guanine deaminase [Stomoxys calcitrans]
MAKVFLGQVIHTKSLNEFIVYTNGFVAVYDGKIVAEGNDYQLWKNAAASAHFPKDAEIIKMTKEQFLMPGLIDCHIHAPQVAQIGLGLDMPLLDWLNFYTFPLEAKFADQEFAAKVYSRVVESTIKSGTTLASYFGTNNKDSTITLAKEALRQGQRALVGKVCSNCNSPDFYVENTQESVCATKAFVDDMKKLGSDLVKPTITPRFALSCTKELLKALGDIAKENNLHIQSHISESVDEVHFVKSIFSSSYAEAYDKAGLLTNKTVMAHAVHLEDDEIALFRERGTSVAHCPASNTMLSSGFCDVLRLIENGIKVGLGTDVSGGNSISIQDAILRALDVSHHLEFVKKQYIFGTGKMQTENSEYTPINYKQAIYLATLGGAEALTMDKVCGNFEIGKEFDALVVDTSIYPSHNFGLYNPEDYEKKSDEVKLLEMVQKFIYTGDDRNIVQVYVAGKQIKSI